MIKRDELIFSTFLPQLILIQAYRLKNVCKFRIQKNPLNGKCAAGKDVMKQQERK